MRNSDLRSERETRLSFDLHVLALHAAASDFDSESMAQPPERMGDPEPRSPAHDESYRGESYDNQDHHDDTDNPQPRKRQRVRLSCLECRRRKLSCDRELPCSRCILSGTADKCEYEVRPGLQKAANRPGLSQSPSIGNFDPRMSLGAGDSLLLRFREHDRIRKLEDEVAQLKQLVAKQSCSDGSTVVEHSPANQRLEPEPEPPSTEQVQAMLPASLQRQEAPTDKEELRFYRGKEFKGRFFGPQNAYLAFSELAGLSPFMKETSDEWLRPLQKLQNRKNRRQDTIDREQQFLAPDVELEAMLPSKAEADAGITLYLHQYEQMHRIVHIPSFRREYANFWNPHEKRSAAFTVLVLAILSATNCVRDPVSQQTAAHNTTHATAVRWIAACDEWLEHQSQKHRRLIHYQIACVLYLSKRINTVKKKRFWKNAGALVQDAVSVGLHREPNPKVSPFNREMRRRIWSTIESFDLQASFDHGLPSLLALLSSDAAAPRNIDDEDFDEDSEEIPESKPVDEYTYSSYQHVSRRGLPLRLELCRVLTGPPNDLSYDDVIRYTSEITREIDSLPSWNAGEEKVGEGTKSPLLAYTLLHIQLRGYIIPLHQTYIRLRSKDSKYQYSQMVYYSAVRDMILLLDALMKQGIRALNFFSEANLTLAINICSIAMLQPRGSTNMIMISSISSHEAMSLMEKCLAMKEDRILRSGNNEPWGYSTMCAAKELLAVHLGEKTTEVAKASAAERFIALHLKLIGNQGPTQGQQEVPSSQQSNPPQQTSSAQQSVPPSSYNPLAAISAAAAGLPSSSLPPLAPDMSARSKSVTPFPPGSQSQWAAVNLNSGPIEVPGTPMWAPNPTDQSNMTPMQPLNLDYNFSNFELFGLDLNNLWGDTTEWDTQLY